MNYYIDILFEEYADKGLLIDANLLLLDVVGSFNIRLVGNGKYNKLSSYTQEDFHLLALLKGMFKKIVTTSHVLAEVSNLTGDLPEGTKLECFKHFPQALEGTDELALDSFRLFRRPEFCFLGLTDSGLVEVAKDYLIVSDDARMIGKLNQSGIQALNFNHLRLYLLPEQMP